jgi:hypothetical protein
VLWEVGSGSAKRSLWWGATIKCIANPGHTPLPRSATIRYAAQHGYGEVDSSVVFVSDSVLESGEGRKKRVQHLWRVLPTTSGGGRGNAESNSRLDKSTVLQRGASEFDTHRDRIDRETDVGLSGRVESLEKQVRTVITLVQRNAVDPYVHSGRALRFARHRLGLELSKALPGTVQYLNKYRDAHIVNQSCLSVHVDCTLEEFEHLSTSNHNCWK